MYIECIDIVTGNFFPQFRLQIKSSDVGSSMVRGQDGGFVIIPSREKHHIKGMRESLSISTYLQFD